MRTEIIQANLGTGSESHPYLMTTGKQNGVLSRRKRRRGCLIRGWNWSGAQRVVVVVVEVAAGTAASEVVVSWCVVVVEVVSGVDEQAPRLRAAEAQRARRISLVFIIMAMMG